MHTVRKEEERVMEDPDTMSLEWSANLGSSHLNSPIACQGNRGQSSSGSHHWDKNGSGALA